MKRLITIFLIAITASLYSQDIPIYGNFVIYGNITETGNLIDTDTIFLASGDTIHGLYVQNDSLFFNGSYVKGTSESGYPWERINATRTVLKNSSDTIGFRVDAPLQELHFKGNSFFDGNMGIGSSIPTQKLDVSGNIAITNLSGGLFIKNNASITTPTSQGIRIGNPLANEACDFAWNASQFDWEVASGGIKNFNVYNSGNGIKLNVGHATYDSSNELIVYGDIVSSGFRTIDLSRSGVINIKGDAGTWLNYYQFKGSGGTILENFGAFGAADALNYSFIGTDYMNPTITFKSGNVGIGTTTPDEKLHIVGTIKLVDGNQADGAILTSDANGKSSWQEPSEYFGSLKAASVSDTIEIKPDNYTVLHTTAAGTDTIMSYQDSLLTIYNGVTFNTTTVNTATYNVLSSDYIIHVAYTATGAVTSLTLPSSQVLRGRTIIIKDTGGASANNITIDTEGSETIDGAATYVLDSDYDAITLYCDGSNWFVI